MTLLTDSKPRTAKNHTLQCSIYLAPLRQKRIVVCDCDGEQTATFRCWWCGHTYPVENCASEAIIAGDGECRCCACADSMDYPAHWTHVARPASADDCICKRDAYPCNKPCVGLVEWVDGAPVR